MTKKNRGAIVQTPKNEEIPMLTAMRDGAKSGVLKFILFGFMTLAVGGLVLTDVGGFFNSGGVGTNMVARVGQEKMGMVQFDDTVRRTLAQQGMTTREAYQFGLIDQILRNHVSASLMTQSAMDNGIFISDDETARQINTIIEPMARQNPTLSRGDILQQFLRQQSMSEQQLVSIIRNGVLNSVVSTTIQSAGTTPAKAEARAIYLYRNESREVSYTVLRHDTVKDDAPVEDDVIVALYEASKSTRYAIPETRQFTVAVLNEASVRDAVVITDEELRAEYDLNIAAYTQPERRAVQQAVLPDEDSARAVIAAVEGGKTLKDAAGKNYQGAQSYERTGLDAAIAEDVFAADEKKAIGPFRSPLGWSVMVVEKTIPQAVRPFDSVKGDLLAQMRDIRMGEHIYNTANAIDDRLAAGEDFNAVAADMKLKLTKIGPVRGDGSTSESRDGLKDFEKDRDTILKTAFDLLEGESAPVMEMADGSYATLRVDTIVPVSFKPFESVRDELARTWRDDRRQHANQLRAKDALTALESGSQTLEQVAAAHGAKLEKSVTLKRAGDPPAVLGAQAHAAIFNAAKDGFVIAPTPDGFVIARVNTIKHPDPEKIPAAEIEKITSELARTGREELMQSFMIHLEKEKGVKLNRALLDRMYGPESGT